VLKHSTRNRVLVIDDDARDSSTSQTLHLRSNAASPVSNAELLFRKGRCADRKKNFLEK